MNSYTDIEKEAVVGTLMLGFIGISALVGLVPLGYVISWIIKLYL